MGLINLTCDKCGAALIPVKEGLFLCEHCNTVYKDEVQINSTTYNHNETIVKNYYGDASITAQTKDKINGYFKIIISDFAEGEYDEAKDFCIRILGLDPDNIDAFAIKTLIDKYKGKSNQSTNDILNLIVSSNLLGKSAEEKPFLIKLLSKSLQTTKKYILNFENSELDSNLPFNKSKLHNEIYTIHTYFQNRKCENCNYEIILKYIETLYRTAKNTFEKKKTERKHDINLYKDKKMTYERLITEHKRLLIAKKALLISIIPIALVTFTIIVFTLVHTI